MKILEKVKQHHKEKTYCTVFRVVDGHLLRQISGYIVDYSEHFLVVQETDDFILKGFQIIPLATVTKLRNNRNDKYQDLIMRWEKIWDTVNYIHQVDLTSWTTIFTDIQIIGFNVIIENEHPNAGTFDIGPILKVTEKHVQIRYFNAEGILKHSTTKLKFKHITLATFDDRYINIFSKYLREPE